MAKATDEAKEKKPKKPLTLLEVMDKYKMKAVTEYDAVDRLPTGSLYLDEALGGGWAVGRIQELWGEPSNGKSLMAMISMGRAVRMGLRVVLFDIEFAFDPEWAKFYVDYESPLFMLIQPEANTYGERILDMIMAMCELPEDEAPALIVLDSKDALSFEAEIEGQSGSSFMGVRSQRLTHFIRRVSQIVGATNRTFLFISQVKANFGDTYNPLTTSGGWAMDHFSAIQVKTNMLQKLKATVNKKEIDIGKELNFVNGKNKTAEAKRTAKVRVRELVTTEGSLWAGDSAYEVLDFGTKMGMFTNTAGEVYSGAGNIIWKDRNLGMWNAAHLELMAEPTLLYELETEVRKRMGWLE